MPFEDSPLRFRKTAVKRKACSSTLLCLLGDMKQIPLRSWGRCGQANLEKVEAAGESVLNTRIRPADLILKSTGAVFG